MVTHTIGPPRPGHSLPELIVTVTFLGVALASVGASSVLGARWAMDGLRRQEGVRLAAAVLDSVSAAPTATSGGGETELWIIQWDVEPDGGILVRVRARAGAASVRLEGRRRPSLPVLPDPEPVGAEP